jgi:hypothetical protein
VGDGDGDGVPDVALTSSRGNQGVLWILRGLGDGSFSLVSEVADGVHDGTLGLYAASGVVLADLDRDGRDDVCLSDAIPAACAGNGYPCPDLPGSNRRPGARDLAAWAAPSLPGGAPGAFRPARTGFGPALDGNNPCLCACDLDGDGSPDLAVFGGFRDASGMGLAFLRGDGAGGFAPLHVQTTAYSRRFGARLDADRDACDDVVAVGGDGPSASALGHDWSVAECWLGGADVPRRAWTSGSEEEPGGSIPGSNPGRVAVADFDGDGLDDFAVSQSFHVKERFQNEQGPGPVPGVCVFLNRSR